MTLGLATLLARWLVTLGAHVSYQNQITEVLLCFEIGTQISIYVTMFRGVDSEVRSSAKA